MRKPAEFKNHHVKTLTNERSRLGPQPGGVDSANKRPDSNTRKSGQKKTIIYKEEKRVFHKVEQNVITATITPVKTKARKRLMTYFRE